jgi:membrane-bound ClpP family serine protease
MGLDIKLPIGAMFAILGLLLTIYGLVTASDTEMYVKSLHVNINLWIGATMLVFGVIMLLLVKRPKKESK